MEPCDRPAGADDIGLGRLSRFRADRRGQSLRAYVTAVVVAAVLAISVLTLLAERIYLLFIRAFGP